MHNYGLSCHKILNFYENRRFFFTTKPELSKGFGTEAAQKFWKFNLNSFWKIQFVILAIISVFGAEKFSF